MGEGFDSWDSIASKALSAASIPDLMALCVPLILGTFKNPAPQPIKQPPGNESFGRDWIPPSARALAPYAILEYIKQAMKIINFF